MQLPLLWALMFLPSDCEFREAASLLGQRPAEVEDTLTAFG